MILVLFIDPVVDYRLKRKRAFHSFIIKIHDTRVHIRFVISLANPREIRFLFTIADAKDVRENFCLSFATAYESFISSS